MSQEEVFLYESHEEMIMEAVIAERPHLVERLFIRGKNGYDAKAIAAGKIEMRLYHNGQWTNVSIDDQFPVYF